MSPGRSVREGETENGTAACIDQDRQRKRQREAMAQSRYGEPCMGGGG